MVKCEGSAWPDKREDPAAVLSKHTSQPRPGTINHTDMRLKAFTKPALLWKEGGWAEALYTCLSTQKQTSLVKTPSRCLKNPQKLYKKEKPAAKTWLLVATRPSALSQKRLQIATSLQFPERRLEVCEAGIVTELKWYDKALNNKKQKRLLMARLELQIIPWTVVNLNFLNVNIPFTNVLPSYHNSITTNEMPHKLLYGSQLLTFSPIVKVKVNYLQHNVFK